MVKDDFSACFSKSFCRSRARLERLVTCWDDPLKKDSLPGATGQRIAAFFVNACD